MPTREININDIARKLGVSKSTVSKALNDRADVGEKTKKRVRQLAAKLNYAPNHFAQALNFRESKLVGIIMHDEIHEGFFAQLVRSISGELQKHGYASIFASSAKSGDMEREILKEHLSRFVDGFILIPCSNTDVKFINGIIVQGTKLVTVDNYVEGIRASFIGTDFTMGSYLATKFLIDAGHTRIGYIGGPAWATSTTDLADGYRKAHREAGLEISRNLMVGCEYDEVEAKGKFVQLIKNNPDMTAVHGAGSTMSIGAMTGAADLGLNVPADISITSAGSTTSVTSLDQKCEEIGRTASRILLDLLDGEKVPPKSIIAPTLVVRNSVRKVSGKGCPRISRINTNNS
jgi:LacI family transcriptional regulator